MADSINESVITTREGSNVTFMVNRADALNALNPDVLQSFILGLEKFKDDSTVKTVVITGQGEKAFVAGADIRSMYDLGPRAIADYVELGQRTMRLIENFHTPVIAAVNGFALGGGLELALACDLIVASNQAKVGQPEVNLGIIPGFGGTQRLIQRAGIGTARRLCYTGDLISAEEAQLLGVVDKVVPHAELQNEIKKITDNIASKAPLAIEEVKRVIRQSQEASLLTGLRLEVESFLRLFGTRDREEGMKAFLEKRRAEFKSN